LKTLEAGFGLKYLNHAADKNVNLITDLFNWTVPPLVPVFNRYREFLIETSFSPRDENEALLILMNQCIG
jgi:hypothetical protein